MRTEIAISEIFGITIQGEGALIGRPTVFVRTGGCDSRCDWCVAPETLITLADWTSKAARDVRTGDEIIGLARRANVPETVGTYRTGTVLGVASRRASRVGVTFEDGREVCVASEHAFSTFKSGRFRVAAKLQAGDKVRALQHACAWSETSAYRTGYLAGAADGDGSFHPKVQAGIWHFVIATADDEILHRFQKYACDLGFALQNGRHLSGGQFAPARHIGCLRLTRSGEVLRFQQLLKNHDLTADFCRGYFAGMFDTDGSTDGKTLALNQFKPLVRERIARVLDVLDLNYSLDARGFRLRGGLSVSRRVLRETQPVLSRKTARILWARGGCSEYATVQKVEAMAEGEVISIKTSLGTYIANGIVSRNCDTLYAVLPEYRGDWHPHSASQILDRVFELSGGQPILITLSGGNPALQPLQPLIELGRAHGCRFALETQGTVAKMWFSQLDYLTLSPKPPSSKMVFRPEQLAQCVRAARSIEDFDGVQKVAERVQSTAERCGPSISLKIVIFDEADYQFARDVAGQFADLPVYLQVGNASPAQPHNDWTGDGDASGARAGVEWLIERVMRDGWSDVTILPQLHVLLWGNARGV